LQGSNDGSAWTTLDTRVGVSWGAVRKSSKEFYFNNTIAYSFYKWNITVNNGSSNIIQVQEFAFGNGVAESTPPSAPTNLVASLIDQQSCTLSWSASTDNVGVAGYELFVNGVSKGTTDLTTMAVSGLNPSMTYAITVKAYDAVGNFSAPGALSVSTTAADVTPPTVPTNVVASAISYGGFTLAWTPSTDALGVTEYQVYNGTALLGTSTTNSISFGGLDAATATTYAITVRAKDYMGNVSAPSTPAVSVTTPLAPVFKQIASWDLVNYRVAPKTGTLTSAPVSTTISSGVTVSDLTTTFTNTAQDPNGITTINNNATNLAEAIAKGEYFEFTIAPVGGKQLTIGSIGLALLNQGVHTYCLLSNKKGFTAANEIAHVTTANPYVQFWDNPLSKFYISNHDNLTSAITFRIYIYLTNGISSFGTYDRAGIGSRRTSEVAADFIINGLLTGADSQNPTAPGQPVVTDIRATTATLSWPAATDDLDVISYEVFKNGTISCGTTTNTSLNITGLTAATTFSFTVVAMDGVAKLSPASTALSVTTTEANYSALGTGMVWPYLSNVTANGSPVATPAINDGDLVTDVALAKMAFQNKNQGVGILWPIAKAGLSGAKFFNGAFADSKGVYSGVADLKIQYSVDGATTWTATDWVCTPAYLHTAAAASQPYTFTGTPIATAVKGIRLVGQLDTLVSKSLNVREFEVVGPDAQDPTAPAGLVAANVDSKTLTLSWTASTDDIGVIKYEVFRGGTISCGTSTGTSLYIGGLTSATAYSFTVKAIDVAGKYSVASAPLPVTTAAYLLGDFGVVESFDDNTKNPGWNAGSCTFTEVGGELKINPAKATVWDAIDFKFTPTQLDISSAPYLSLKIKTNIDFNIWVAIGTAGGKVDNFAAKLNTISVDGAQEVVASDLYQTYTFDFSAVPLSALQTANNVHIILNPMAIGFGSPSSATSPVKEIYFDDLRIGDLALHTPEISTIQEQNFTAQAAGTASRTVKFRNVTDGSTGTHPITITATSSNTAIIPNPTVTYSSPAKNGSLVLNPNLTGTGESLITVTVSAANTTPKLMTFKVKVLPNAAPSMQLIPNVAVKKGQPVTLKLYDIRDNNPESTQEVTLTGVSSNLSAIPAITVLHNPAEYVGTLSFTPATSSPSGTAVPVTITLKDNGGTAAGGLDTNTSTFTVTLFDEVNNPPTLAPISAKSIKALVKSDQILLEGIGTGDAAAQTLTFTVMATANSIISNLAVGPVVDGIAPLTFDRTGEIGSATITVTVTDNGGTTGNNGNQSITRSFLMTAFPAPITGHAPDYSEFVIGAPNYNPNYTGVINYAGKAEYLPNNVVHLTGLVPAFNFPSTYIDFYNSSAKGKEIDISANKFVSFKVKSSSATLSMGKPLATTVITARLIDDISPNAAASSTSGYGITSIKLEVPNDDAWHDVYLDYKGLFSKMEGGFPKSTDSTRIHQLMLDINLTYFKEETIDVYLKDIKLGDLADRPIPTPAVTIDGISSQTYYLAENPKPILLTGISDGNANKTATLSVTTDKPSLVTGLSVTPVVNGTSTLNYSLAAGVSDSATVTVIGRNLAVGTSIPDTVSFKIYVMDKAAVPTSTVSISFANTHQTIGGVGCFMEAAWNSPAQIQQIKEMNITAIRATNAFQLEFEPVNDNSDPNVTDYSNFDYTSLPTDILRNINENTNCHTFFYTIWTSPWWMKQIKAEYPASDAQWAANNRLKPEMYEEFAEYVVAICQVIKQNAGVELYAISLQNEPTFNEPYVSTQFNGAEFRELVKVVGPRMKAAGLKTLIMLSEDVNQSGWVQGNVGPTNEDPIAREYLGVVACHNYDPDGVKAGGAGAAAWAELSAFTKSTPADGLWMTETSGFSNVWEGEMIVDYLRGGLVYAPGPFDFAGVMYTAFKYGELSGWTDLDKPVDKFSQNMRGGAFRNYSGFVNHGSVMVDATSSNENILSLAFKNPDNSTTAILLNKSTAPMKVTLQGTDVPLIYQSYTTHNYAPFAKGATVTDGSVLLPPRSVTTLFHSVVNVAPIIDQPANQNVILADGDKVLTLAGIGYGADVAVQNVTAVTATSSNTAIAKVEIVSTVGGTTADLKITPVALGTVTVTVTVKDDGGVVNGGVDQTTLNFTVTVSDFTDLNELGKAVISMYPNPANDYVVVGLDNVSAEKVFITDISGCIIRQETVAKGSAKVQIPVSNLPKGLYFVTVKTKGQTQTMKLVLQ